MKPNAAGDAVLIDFAQTIRAQFWEGDVVGRIGGDEFVAVLPIPDVETARRKADELARALNRQVPTDTGVCAVSPSIGVAISPEAGEDFETLYRNADKALYQAKAQGKNGYAIYKP